MKKGSTMFLRAVVVLIGIGVLAFLLWEPQVEGVNANATNLEIYFKDPFLAFVYLGSVPFFVALYKAFKVLGYARQDQAFTETTTKALKAIRHCMLVTAGAIVAAGAYIRIAAEGSGDDPAGALALGMVAIFICIVTAAVATVIERTIQNAPNLKQT
jgi:hypothetical protein